MSDNTANILDAIGDTPLLDLGDGVWAKGEHLNPSGSIKARIAKYIIEKAEEDGLIKPGDTIVESTSGNCGNALSMVAAVKGYKMLVVIPEGYTGERTQISKGFGAEIEYVGNFHVDKAREYAIEMGQKDGYFCPQQFDNELNVEENREILAQEIIGQLPDGLKIDAVVQGIGTGGTLIGTVQGLRRDHNPNVKSFGMEPSESPTLGCCIVAKHKIEGIADGFIPTIVERHRDDIDDIIEINSDEAIEAAQMLSREKGLFVGPSSGGNYLAALEVKKRYPEMENILTFMCDEGEKYLSLMYKL